MSNGDIAREWRRDVSRDYRWRRASNQTGGLQPIPAGEAGGLYVECDRLPGRRAYLKPTKPDTGIWRSSREKIAADLAHDLSVNVPPGLLAGPVNESDEKRTFVSLVLYPRQWSWGELRRILDRPKLEDVIRDHVRPKLEAAASDAFVFDAWVGQWDHDDHDHNMLFGYDPSDYANGSFVFLDFAFSLGAGSTWTGDGFKQFSVSRFPPLMLKSLDNGRISTMINKIEDLETSTVQDVVHRIPKDYLPEPTADEIASGLLARRELLRKEIKQYLGGSL